MPEFIVPQWSAPKGVRALVSTRRGGISAAPWQSFNLGDHVGDDPASVAGNRARLRGHLPDEPAWLHQVHGTRCVDAAPAQGIPEADASFTRQRGVVCAVLTADCLPVLLCNDAATVVGIAHAGWRGLAAGIIESTLAAMDEPPANLLAWLGPAIGPLAFEVGDEVRAAFIADGLTNNPDNNSGAASAFRRHGEGKWLCDIYALARQRLNALGIRRVAGADFCTLRDAAQFFSYRRDGVTGRMASCVWLEPA